MDVLVVGSGSMGRWFGEVLGDADVPDTVDTAVDVSVSYYDERLAAAERAAEETGGTAVSSPVDAYDVVCIAVPIPAATAAIAAHAGRATRAAVDVTGTMSEPVAALGEHAPEVERCSFHPLFAPDREPGNVPMVVDEGGPVTRFLRETLEARGNTPFETTAKEHDEMMEVVQARTHAAILAYGLASEPVPDRYQTSVSATLSDLVERVAGGDARVYSDIQDAFEGADDVAEAASRLAEANGREFEQLYTEIQR